MKRLRIILEQGVTYYTKEIVEEYTLTSDVTADNYADKKASLYVQGTDGYELAGDSFAEGTNYYTKTESTVYTETTTPADASEVFIKKITTAGENVLTDNVITSLTQNEATQVSVLVYLDGEHITNAHVASTAATSVTGTMNLQFASSANLVPMEYADLHIPATENTPDESGDAGEETN
jgi:hypothetical protein